MIEYDKMEISSWKSKDALNKPKKHSHELANS